MLVQYRFSETVVVVGKREITSLSHVLSVKPARGKPDPDPRFRPSLPRSLCSNSSYVYIYSPLDPDRVNFISPIPNSRYAGSCSTSREHGGMYVAQTILCGFPVFSRSAETRRSSCLKTTAAKHPNPPSFPPSSPRFYNPTSLVVFAPPLDRISNQPLARRTLKRSRWKESPPAGW